MFSKHWSNIYVMMLSILCGLLRSARMICLEYANCILLGCMCRSLPSRRMGSSWQSPEISAGIAHIVNTNLSIVKALLWQIQQEWWERSLVPKRSGEKARGKIRTASLVFSNADTKRFRQVLRLWSCSMLILSSWPRKLINESMNRWTSGWTGQNLCTRHWRRQWYSCF